MTVWYLCKIENRMLSLERDPHISESTDFQERRPGSSVAEGNSLHEAVLEQLGSEKERKVCPLTHSIHKN